MANKQEIIERLSQCGGLSYQDWIELLDSIYFDGDVNDLIVGVPETNILPTPTSESSVITPLLNAGTYTWNGQNFVIPEGFASMFLWKNSTWSLSDLIPVKGADGKVIVDWTAKAYAIGDQVFHLGKIYQASAATVAGEVPAVSDKWVEKVGITAVDGFLSSSTKDAGSANNDRVLNNKLKPVLEDLNTIFTLDNTTFEIGNINATTGVDVASPNYLRSIGYLSGVVGGVELNLFVKYNYRAIVYQYNDAGVLQSVSPDFNYGSHVITPSFKNVRIIFRNGVNSTPIVLSELSNLVLSQKRISISTSTRDNKTKINTISNFVEGRDLSFTWNESNVEFGNLNVGTGAPTANNNNVRTKDFIFPLLIGDKIKITVPPGAVINVLNYSIDSLGVASYKVNDFTKYENTDTQPKTFEHTATSNAIKIFSTTNVALTAGDVYKVTYKINSLDSRLTNYFDLDRYTFAPYDRELNFKLDPLNFTNTGTRVISIREYNGQGVKRIKVTPPAGISVGIAGNKNGVFIDTGLRVNLDLDTRGYDSFKFVFGGTSLSLDLLANTEVIFYYAGIERVTKAIKPKHKGITLDLGADSWAHRGTFLDGIAPENSIDSLIMSARAGFKWSECDIMKTSDGQVVVFHDSMIARTLRNKSDYSVVSPDVAINSLTLAQLQANYVLISKHSHQRKPVPTLKEHLIACNMVHIKPLIELKDSFSNSELDDLFTLCASVMGLDNFGFISLGDGIALNYLKAKYSELVVAYGGGIYTNPSAWEGIAPKNTYISVGNNWIGANAETQAPLFNAKGVKIIVYGVEMDKMLQFIRLGIHAFSIDTVPPFISDKHSVIFSVDSSEKSAENVFLKNGNSLGFLPDNEDRYITLLAGETLTLAPYIDNESIAYGAAQVYCEFSGKLNFTGTRILNNNVDSATQINSTFLSRTFITGRNLNLKVVAAEDTVIHRLCVKAVKY